MLVVLLLLLLLRDGKNFDNNFHDWKANNNDDGPGHREMENEKKREEKWSRIDGRKLFFNKLKAFAHTHTNRLEP